MPVFRLYQMVELWQSHLDFASPANCPHAPLMSLPKLALRVLSIPLPARACSNALTVAGLGALNLSQRPFSSLVTL
jgi:hypothetical protein